MTEEQIKELALDVVENYFALTLNDDFDSTQINEQVFLGIVYANLVTENAAMPTEDGLALIETAKESLEKFISESPDEEAIESLEDWSSEDE
jgi:hypothetical protein